MTFPAYGEMVIKDLWWWRY